MTFVFSDQEHYPGVKLQVEAQNAEEARERLNHVLQNVYDAEDLTEEQV